MDTIAHEAIQTRADGNTADPAQPEPRTETRVRKTIFVQIAAYRDSECISTITDLFQKAAKPDDLSVGVCWQFLPGVDPETLALNSFQNRVRVLGVDAAKSRGVCWARHQAEQF